MIKAVLIDDEPHCLGTLGILLKEYCSDVRIMDQCHSATKALQIIETIKPDLVFLDIEMPGMNGEQLANVIRQLTPAKPIIMLTGFADMVGKAGIHASNIDLVIAKPASLEELRRAIFDVLMRDRHQDATDLEPLAEAMTA